MRVVKRQSARRKRNLIGYVNLLRLQSALMQHSAGRLVRIKVRNINRHFTVHADLLCATSKHFKKRLQEHRKPVEGECSICYEVLDPAVADITFCGAQCGQNMHQHCVDKWMKTKDGAKTCAFCRAAWKTRNPSTVALPSKTDLKSEAVQLYIDWLYSDTFRVNLDIAPDSDNYNVCLLEAWTVASAAQDTDCERAIMAHLMSQFNGLKNFGLGLASINYTFDTAWHKSAMRNFIRETTFAQGMTVSVMKAKGPTVEKFRNDMQERFAERRSGVLITSSGGDYSIRPGGGRPGR